MSFDLDAAGLVDWLNEPDQLAVLDVAATTIADTAASNTRRGRSAAMGHIADRYRTEKATPTPDGPKAQVWNDSPVFHLEEFGSIHQGPQRPLTRAAASVASIWEPT